MRLNLQCINQNIGVRVKKLSKIGQDQSILLSVFAITKVSFLKGRLDTRIPNYLTLKTFLIFLNLPESQVMIFPAIEVSFANYQVPLCLWWRELLVTFCTGWKYCDQHCRLSWVILHVIRPPIITISLIVISMQLKLMENAVVILIIVQLF